MKSSSRKSNSTFTFVWCWSSSGESRDSFSVNFTQRCLLCCVRRVTPITAALQVTWRTPFLQHSQTHPPGSNRLGLPINTNISQEYNISHIVVKFRRKSSNSIYKYGKTSLWFRVYQELCLFSSRIFWCLKFGNICPSFATVMTSPRSKTFMTFRKKIYSSI